MGQKRTFRSAIPLYPRKQTLVSLIELSAKGQKRTLSGANGMELTVGSPVLVR